MKKAIRIVMTLVVMWTGLLAGPRVLALSLSVEEPIPKGLVDYLIPRFTLKTRVRFDRVIDNGDLSFTVNPHEGAVSIFKLVGGRTGYLTATAAALEDPSYERFRDWLLSPPGRATIADYREDDRTIAEPVDVKAKAAISVVIVGDLDAGKILSVSHCRRCHKVDRADKYSGMDSSPSFHAMRSFDDWFVRFSIFYTVSPHKALIQVAGSGIDQNPDLIPIAPIKLTFNDINDIVAFVHSLEPLDLGKPVQMNP